MARAPKPPAAKKSAPQRSARPATPKPARPKGLAHGRWLGDFPDLSPAEKRLVECCARGEIWEPEGCNGKRPEAVTAANTIRAELIRFLALGGDDGHPVHEEGVVVLGASVEGLLVLHQCVASARLALQHCRFTIAPIFLSARLPELSLNGCKMPGLRAGRIKVSGGVYLRDGFTSTGEVCLRGAKIGGNLECGGSTFTDAEGSALYADGIKVTGDVFLHDGFAATGQVRLVGAEIGGDLECSGGTFKNNGGNALLADRIKVAGGVFLRGGFAAIGQVRLQGAEIGDSLDCDGGTFKNNGGNALQTDGIKIAGSVLLRGGFAATGQVRLLGAEIGGNLECGGGTFTNAGGDALCADGFKVAGNVSLRGAKVDGPISLSAARIGTLNDDDACWAAGGHFLDGLHYDGIIGPTDAALRIRWLERQHASQLGGRDWSPQPWEQVIKTLRDMGHPLEATKVAIAKQERMRRAGKVDGRFAQLLHWFYGFLAGYGYRPLRTVRAMVVVWLGAALCFHLGGQSGYLGPTTPLYNSPALSGQVEQQCGHGSEPGKTPWTRCPAMPAEYTTFQPIMYSLDLILPLVDLQQETDWAPIVEDPPGNTLWFGAALRWLMWFEILFGWAMSLMLVAVLGKLVNKD